MRHRPLRALFFRWTSRVLCITLLAQTFPAPAAIAWAEPPAPAEPGAEKPTPESPPPPGFDVRLLTDRAGEVPTGRPAPADPPPAAAPSFDQEPPSPPASAGSAVAPGTPVVVPAGLTAPYLLPGDNLASIPGQSPDPSPAAVFASIAGKFIKVFALSPCSPKEWKIYDPANPAGNDLTAVDPTMGFWIEMTEPAPLPAPGPVPDRTTLHLCAGWNLIGFPAEQARPVRTALSSIEGKYARVFGFDVADAADPWELFDPAIPWWANDLELLQPGRAYWILMTEAADLTVSNVATEPELALAAPSDLSVITAPTEVTGTVRSDTPRIWTWTSTRGPAKSSPISTRPSMPW